MLRGKRGFIRKQGTVDPERALKSDPNWVVVDALLQRGFEKIEVSSIEETLLYEDGACFFGGDESKSNRFLDELSNKEFRKLVREVINGDESLKSELADKGWHFSMDNSNREKYRKKYSKTIELLIADLCLKHLAAHGASFGVRMKDTPKGGDYDCICVFQNGLYSFEVKSGKAGELTTRECKQFLLRHDFLSPEASVLFLDYTGVKDEEVKKFLGLKLHSSMDISRIFKFETETGRAYMVDSGIVVVDLANNDSLLTNIRFALQILNRYNVWHRSSSWNLVEPQHLGLNGKIFSL